MKIITIIGIVTIMLLSCTSSENSKIENITSIESNSKLQVLLVGTSHWKAYKRDGNDYAKFNEIDILSHKYQKEVSEISEKFADFNPDKIFVEKYVTRQFEIDSLYKLYKSTNWGDTLRDETYQLGFRTAKKLDLAKVFCIANFHYEFPMDSVKRSANKNNQNNIVKEFNDAISDMINSYQELVQNESNLADILLHWNSSLEEKRNIGWYINNINQIGNDNEYAGSFLASQQYLNNLNVLGLVQRKIEKSDKRIIIIMGSAHTAFLKDLIEYIPDWEVVELQKVIK